MNTHFFHYEVPIAAGLQAHESARIIETSVIPPPGVELEVRVVVRAKVTTEYNQINACMAVFEPIKQAFADQGLVLQPTHIL